MIANWQFEFQCILSCGSITLYFTLFPFRVSISSFYFSPLLEIHSCHNLIFIITMFSTHPFAWTSLNFTFYKTSMSHVCLYLLQWFDNLIFYFQNLAFKFNCPHSWNSLCKIIWFKKSLLSNASGVMVFLNQYWLWNSSYFTFFVI